MQPGPWVLRQPGAGELQRPQQAQHGQLPLVPLPQLLPLPLPLLPPSLLRRLQMSLAQEGKRVLLPQDQQRTLLLCCLWPVRSHLAAQGLLSACVSEGYKICQQIQMEWAVLEFKAAECKGGARSHAPKGCQCAGVQFPLAPHPTCKGVMPKWSDRSPSDSSCKSEC